MRRVRIILWVLVALTLAAFAFLMLRPVDQIPTQQQPLAISSIGGPFTLTGSDGKPFSSTTLAGKPYAIFFGFTHCPDVCPTTLVRMVRLRQQLGAGDRPFEILFVTVDPERDGPAEVGKYAELFDSPVTGLTGSPATLDTTKGIIGQPGTASGISVWDIDLKLFASATPPAYTIGNLLTDVETAFQSLSSASAALGSIKMRIGLQEDFVSKLTDSIDSGIGRLVDADMNEESTRLKALQTQQQLGIQSLSIANTSSENILSLFRQ